MKLSLIFGTGLGRQANGRQVVRYDSNKRSQRISNRIIGLFAFLRGKGRFGDYTTFSFGTSNLPVKNVKNYNRLIHRARFWGVKVLIVTAFALLNLMPCVADTQNRDSLSKAPQSIKDRLTQGQSQDLIIVFDVDAIQRVTSNMRRKASRMHDDAAILAFKATQYTDVKQRVLTTLPANEVVVLHDYDHLPMVFVRLHSLGTLKTLERHANVSGIYENRENFPFLSESLPLINQPQAYQADFLGAGTTVAVMDTGTDYTRSAFGSCITPGVPAGCKVVVSQDFAQDDGELDDNGHGSNVAGVVLGVAPETRIAALDVFSSEGVAYDADIIAAID